MLYLGTFYHHYCRSLQFITADKARHLEFASSRSAISKMPCRKCNWELKLQLAVMVLTIIVLLDLKMWLQRCTVQSISCFWQWQELPGGQALLQLKSFDTMPVCPIELLYTIDYAWCRKSFSECLLNEKDFLLPAGKSVLKTKLFGIYQFTDKKKEIIITSYRKQRKCCIVRVILVTQYTMFGIT